MKRNLDKKFHDNLDTIILELRKTNVADFSTEENFNENLPKLIKVIEGIKSN